MSLTLRDVVSALDEAYPPATAQPWDQVGLVSGDLDQPVRRIHAAVDPTLAVIDEAREAGADLLLTHHPLLLRGVHSVATTSAKGASVTSLVVGDVALYVAHTNADVATPGVNTALASACRLDSETVRPLSVEEGQELGLVGDLAAETDLASFVAGLAARLPAAAGGIRVSGPPGGRVRRVALLGGAGDGLFDAVRAADADVYVTSDLRHHPALEAREEAAIGDGRPYLVDAGHWATESLWLQDALDDLVAALAAAGRDTTTVETHVSTIRTDPWTFTVGATTAEGGTA